MNNRIDPGLLNPVALNLLKRLPTPVDDCGRVTYGFVANQDEDLWAAKVDYQISEKQSFFGRFTSAHLNVASTYDGKDPLSINAVGVNDLDYSLALGDTYVFSANVVNALRVSATRTNIVKDARRFRLLENVGSECNSYRRGDGHRFGCGEPIRHRRRVRPIPGHRTTVRIHPSATM